VPIHRNCGVANPRQDTVGEVLGRFGGRRSARAGGRVWHRCLQVAGNASVPEWVEGNEM